MSLPDCGESRCPMNNAPRCRREHTAWLRYLGGAARPWASARGGLLWMSLRLPRLSGRPLRSRQRDCAALEGGS